MIQYFAYGSNMSPLRLSARIAGVRQVGTFRLERHDLKFHKVGRDGSAKCDAHFTGSDEDFVLGVLWEMSEAHKAELDRIEGLGAGYAEAQVSVTSGDQMHTALTYVATKIDARLKPFSWYVTHVLEGAKAAGLPQGYVSGLEAVASQRDSDEAREARELGVYS